MSKHQQLKLFDQDAELEREERAWKRFLKKLAPKRKKKA